MRVIETIILLVFTVICCNAQQIILKDHTSQSYEVDQILKIEWISNSDSSLTLTIDLVNERSEVMMVEKFLIAAEVPAKQQSFSWTIPRFLKSSGQYHVRIYVKDQAAPKPGDPGYGKAFTLINLHPMRQSTLNLLEPTGSSDGLNLESTCLLGEECFVVWDYPEWALPAIPSFIDIKLYSSGTNKMVLTIAENIPVGMKSLTWRVPHSIIGINRDEPVNVVISASDSVSTGKRPGQSFYLASSGYPFILETRSERDSRMKWTRTKDAVTNTSANTDATTTSMMIDVPRPTYANEKGPKASAITSEAVVSYKNVNFISMTVALLLITLSLF